MPYQCHGRPPSGLSSKPTGVDFLTPPSLLVALGALEETDEGEYVLGPDPYDLDPTASVRQPWPTARTMWTVHEDGTQQDWSPFGEVFGNFPYGRDLYSWLSRLAAHGSGTALLYARTDTAGFDSFVWKRADAVFFFTGRIWFHKPVTGHQCDHNSGGPCVLALYGAKSVERAKRLTLPGSPYSGHLVNVRHVTPKGRKR